MHRTSITLLSVLLMTLPTTALAQGDTPDETVVLGGRAEVPDAGYALTFPEDWVYIKPTQGDVDVILDEVSRVIPALAPTIEATLAGGLEISLLAFSSQLDEFPQNCNVIDRASPGVTLDVAAAIEVAKLAGLRDVLAGGPDLTFVELPVGRVARIDLALQLPGSRTESTSFIIIDEDWMHTLTCTDRLRPPDAWVSIVGTFEPLRLPD